MILLFIGLAIIHLFYIMSENENSNLLSLRRNILFLFFTIIWIFIILLVHSS